MQFDGLPWVEGAAGGDAEAAHEVEAMSDDVYGVLC